MNKNNVDTIRELKTFGEDWDRALLENDVNEIGSFMADDWVMVATEGGITSKSSFLDYIKPGGLFHSKMDFKIIKMEINGDTGIVVAKGTSGGTFNEKPFSYFEWSTSVFRKSNTGWLCVITMLTPAVAAEG